MIIDAYHRGLLSKDECTKLLGVDPSILLTGNEKFYNSYDFKSYMR